MGKFKDDEFEDFDLSGLTNSLKNETEEDLPIEVAENKESDPEPEIDLIDLSNSGSQPDAVPTETDPQDMFDPEQVIAEDSQKDAVPESEYNPFADEEEDDFAFETVQLPVGKIKEAASHNPEPNVVPAKNTKEAEDDFADIDLSDHKPVAPMEEPDPDQMTEKISESLNQNAEDRDQIAAPQKKGFFGRRKKDVYEEDYEDDDDDEYEDDEYEDDDRPRHSGLKFAVIGLIGIVAIGGAGFGIKALLDQQSERSFYKSHFLPGTVINGIDVSDMTPAEVAEAFQQSIDEYELQIVATNGTEVLSSDEVSMAISYDFDFKDLLNNQDHTAYETSLENPENYTITTAITVNEGELRSAVESMTIFQNMTPSSSCSIDYNAESEQYELTDAVIGNEVDLPEVEDRIIECFKVLKADLNLEEEGFYGDIVEVSDEVRASLEDMNHALQSSVTLDFEESGSEELDPVLVRQCLVLNDQVVLEFDLNPIKEWINELSQTYDTAEGVHEFETSAGLDIEVEGGTYGWKMDPDATAEAIKTAVLAGETKTMEPEYTSKGAKRGADDIGDTYIEINLSNQRLYYYEDGDRVMSADIVSGDVSEGYMTMTGVYTVISKEETYTTGGTSVTNWLNFYKSVGICGLSSRTNFGGSIYLSNGTSGNVVMSTDDAERLYELVKEEIPVVIYGGESEYVEEEDTSESESETSATASTTERETTSDYRPTTAAPTTEEPETDAPVTEPETDPTYETEIPDPPEDPDMDEDLDPDLE